MRQLSAADRAEHWRQTRNLTIAHLTVWFIFAYVVHWFALPLNNINFFGWPLSFYMGAQGSLVIYVLIIWFYARYMNKLDQEYGVDEGEEE